MYENANSVATIINKRNREENLKRDMEVRRYVDRVGWRTGGREEVISIWSGN